MLRFAALTAGIAIIAAVTHAMIEAGGGYAGHAYLVQAAVALGLVVGALAVGRCWSDRRYALAVVMALALLAGEAFGLISTGERIIAQRDGLSAPIADNEAKRSVIEKRIADAEAAKRADAAVTSQAALPGCKANCAGLLAAAAAAATGDLKQVRAELAALPSSRSAAPLADRLGMPAWILDLAAAALASLAANGLGACLVAFFGHAGTRGPATAVSVVHPHEAAPTAQPVDLTPSAEKANPRGAKSIPKQAVLAVSLKPENHVAKFVLETFEPVDGAVVSVQEVKPLYVRWCERSTVAPLPDQELVNHLASVLKRINRPVVDMAIQGVSVRSA